MSPAPGPAGTSESVEIVVDTSSPVPASEQVQQQVRDSVRLGHLPSGSRLPTIRHLAGHLGVSNGVVARAYRALEDEGLLRTAGRGGTTVAAAPTPDDVDRARREALSRAAAGYASTARALGVSAGAALEAARDALRADVPTASTSCR